MLPLREILIIATFVTYFLEHIESASNCRIPIFYQPSNNTNYIINFGHCPSEVFGSFSNISAKIRFSTLSNSSDSKPKLDFLEAFRDHTYQTECLEFSLGYRIYLSDRSALLNMTVACGGSVKLRLEELLFNSNYAVTMSYDGGRYYLPVHCFPLDGYRIMLDVENQKLTLERNSSFEVASLELNGRKNSVARLANYIPCRCSRLDDYKEKLLRCRLEQFVKKTNNIYKNTEKLDQQSHVSLFVTIISSGLAISISLFVIYNMFIKVIETPNLEQHNIN